MLQVYKNRYIEGNLLPRLKVTHNFSSVLKGAIALSFFAEDKQNAGDVEGPEGRHLEEDNVSCWC